MRQALNRGRMHICWVNDIGALGKERVIAGSDRGFSAFAGYGVVKLDNTWAKLRNLKEGAEPAARTGAQISGRTDLNDLQAARTALASGARGPIDEFRQLTQNSAAHFAANLLYAPIPASAPILRLAAPPARTVDD